MELIDLLLIMSFGAPLFISLVSIALIVAQRRFKDNKMKRKLLALTICYFLCVFSSDFSVILFIFEWNLYIYTSPLSFLSLVLSVVFFYHIIYIITSDDPSKKVSVIHYVIPALLTLIHIVWSLLVPYDVQYNIVANRVLDLDNYKWFCLFYSSKLWVYAVYLIIYSILILKRMPEYHLRIMNYSADDEKSSLRWIYTIIILGLVIIPVSFITFFIKGRGNIIDETIAIIANILYIIQLIILHYNILTENYIIIPKDFKSPSDNQNREESINKKEFENYMMQIKPYLRKNLKITDIIYEFHTCRSYMSSFINRTYDMNFSQYINTFRMKEYERLRKDPDNSKKSDTELISAAGFSYRSFIRFRKNKMKNI